MQTFINILQLGIKETKSVLRQTMLLTLIIYLFSLNIYDVYNSSIENIQDASIAVVNEDNSQLSYRVSDYLTKPVFEPAKNIAWPDMDKKLDAGDFTFVMVVPYNYQRDLMGGRVPTIQLNTDATRMGQAFNGAGYAQAITANAIYEFFGESPQTADSLVKLVVRRCFNQNLTQKWYDAVMEIVSSITLLAVILCGSAIISEREKGTMEHLLVMPITSFEIMASKIWSMALIVLVAAFFSVTVVISSSLGIPINGSLTLFMFGVAIHLIASTSIGIFLATIAKDMPQFGILMILTIVPLLTLSGASSPIESMPKFIRYLSTCFPTTQFVLATQAIIFRGAGMDVVWKYFLPLAALSIVLLGYVLIRFRKSIANG
ncbi:MAG: ABC transporter permease [Synergistaceae bacterium]|nr:ABC transporter permease [Synergistaceae bacterium]